MAGRVEVRDGELRLSLSPEAERSGVLLETADRLGRRDPGALRRLLAASSMLLPADDKLAQLTRALRAWRREVR